MNNLTIGILGGMGPRATVEFEQRLLDQLAGHDQVLPRIVSVNDGRIPDRSSFLLGNGPDPVPRLLDNAKFLMMAGANLVCLPCNTAHAGQILGQLQSLIELPIVDMPAAAIYAAEQLGFSRLLILGTEGTKYSQVFDQRTTSSVCVYPSESDQQMVTNLIAKTKQGSPLLPLKSQLAKVIKSYNTDVAILACTELSLINPSQEIDSPIIDSLDELVKQCILQIDEYNIVRERQ